MTMIKAKIKLSHKDDKKLLMYTWVLIILAGVTLMCILSYDSRTYHYGVIREVIVSRKIPFTRLLPLQMVFDFVAFVIPLLYTYFKFYKSPIITTDKNIIGHKQINNSLFIDSIATISIFIIERFFHYIFKDGFFFTAILSGIIRFYMFIVVAATINRIKIHYHDDAIMKLKKLVLALIFICFISTSYYPLLCLYPDFASLMGVEVYEGGKFVSTLILCGSIIYIPMFLTSLDEDIENLN